MFSLVVDTVDRPLIGIWGTEKFFTVADGSNMREAAAVREFSK